MTIHVSECLLRMHDQHYELEDYQSGVPRWCTGCGDNAILAAVQRLCRDEDLRPEKTVFVSGIGCSSRFPYYMNTFGFHTIHGRAPAVATGIKVAHPELEVWVATGDGDSLAIGGNHTIHMLRRNVGIKVLMFNNKIQGQPFKQAELEAKIEEVFSYGPVGAGRNGR